MAYRTRQYANKFNRGPDEFPGGWAGAAGVQTKGAPSFALDTVQMKTMYEKAAARESFSVRCKDLGFNDTR